MLAASRDSQARGFGDVGNFLCYSYKRCDVI